MTAVVDLEPGQKVCAADGCGRVFEIRPDQTQRAFALTKHCSDECRPSSKARGSGGGTARLPAAVPDLGLLLADLEDGLSWQLLGNCAFDRGDLQADWDLFFPVVRTGRGAAAYEAEVAKAKRMCADCPVRAECLTTAVRLGDDALGIWGGTTKEERDALRRAQLRRVPQS
jgi:hypothetical protein